MSQQNQQGMQQMQQAPQPQAPAAPAPASAPQQMGTPNYPVSNVPGQGGIMGMLNNPLVQGALVGYLQAISTPRYAGRGEAIARGGLGFLQGYGGAEKALSDQEEAELKMEKDRQDIDRERKAQESYDAISAGTATQGDYIRVNAYEAFKYQQNRQDIGTVNKTNSVLFIQAHPNDQNAALIGGAVAKNTLSAIPYSQMEDSWQQLQKDPTLAESIQLDLQQKKATLGETQARIGATGAETAEAAARLPGIKAESAQKATEAEIFTKGTPGMTPADLAEAQRRKVFGGGKTVTWVDYDVNSGQIYGTAVGTEETPPTTEAKGQWVSSTAMGQIGREKRGALKENLRTYQNPKDPTDVYTIDLNKGEQPKPGDLPYKAGAAGKPSFKTFVDENGQTQTIDVNKEPPGRDWKPYYAGAGAPLATERAESNLAKQIRAEWATMHPKPTPPGILAGAPVIGDYFEKQSAAWEAGARKYGRDKYNYDIEAPAPTAPTRETPARREVAPAAAPTPDAGGDERARIYNEWRRYQASNPGAQMVTRTDATGVHHGAQAPGQPPQWFD